MAKSQHFSPGDIQFHLVYDRGQCAESSYLNGLERLHKNLNSLLLRHINCVQMFKSFSSLRVDGLAFRPSNSPNSSFLTLLGLKMRDKMAISAYILKIVEKDPFLRFQMRAKEDFNPRQFLPK